MTTHYIENASSGSQYYFNSNNATTSQQSYRTYASPVTASDYSIYPAGISGVRSPQQQIQLERQTYNQNDPYQLPQQHQSRAGFNKNVSQQYYQSPQSPVHQVRATVRSVGNQDQYHSQPIQVSPQQHHFQFDSRQQPGHATGPAVVYQTPGAAQFTHHNVDLWTENSSQGRDHLVQAQRVSVRPVATGSPQPSYSVSPSRNQDSLQQYYSQLTPEQHQQLLRQQQIQRQQQQQDSHYEQQRHTTAQQSSPTSTYNQEQYRSTASVGGVQQQQQKQVAPIQQQQQQQQRGRLESDRQRQDEQDYYAAQRQMAAQRAQPQEEQFSQPVGIRNLMNKFAGPTPVQKYQPRSKSTTSSRHYSSSSYTSNSAPGQTTSRTLTTHSMTYSALPKSREPPVNSVEYYQMHQQGGNPFTNIQLAAAPAHIQQTATSLGTLRDRFKTGSLSENTIQAPDVSRHQQQRTNAGGNTLSSLRSQYITRAKESAQDELPTQQVQNISRTIVGEDVPRQKQQPPPSAQQMPRQQQESSGQQIPQEQEQEPSAPQSAPQEQPQTQNESVDQPEASSEVAPPPENDTVPDEPEPSSN